MGTGFDMVFECADVDAPTVRKAYEDVDYVTVGTFDDHETTDAGVALFGWYDAFGHPSLALDAVAALGVPFVARVRNGDDGAITLHVPTGPGTTESHPADDEWNLLVAIDPAADPSGLALPESAADFMERTKAVRRDMRRRAKGGA